MTFVLQHTIGGYIGRYLLYLVQGLIVFSVGHADGARAATSCRKICIESSAAAWTHHQCNSKLSRNNSGIACIRTFIFFGSLT